jgi:hypothetical protein
MLKHKLTFVSAVLCVFLLGCGGHSSPLPQVTPITPTPTVASISPTSAAVGDPAFSLAVSGAYFTSSSTVSFDGVILTPTSWTANQLVVTVPTSAFPEVKVVDVTVPGSSSPAQNFNVINPVPALTSLSVPMITTGSSDFSLEIVGLKFMSNTVVNLGSLVLTPNPCMHTQMTVTVPASAIAHEGVLNITATTPGPGGGVSNSLTLTVANPQPALNLVSPPSVTAGSPDVTVTLTGSGFVSDSALAMGQTQMVPEIVSPTEMTVVVPAGSLSQAGATTFTVTNPGPGGGVSNPLAFTIHGLAQLSWSTVVNNNLVMPYSSYNFNSYSQPSVNSNGLVVFKGQSSIATSGAGTDTLLVPSGSLTGIYTRLMSSGHSQVVRIADTSTTVPSPNNTKYNGQYALFTEFPNFPRIDIAQSTVAFRGQHLPVYTYTPKGGSKTSVGSAGIYSNPVFSLSTGVGQMAAAPGYSYFQVPGAASGTHFDQFPGAPAIDCSSILAFQGNYTEAGISETGVYYRDLLANFGQAPVGLIANTSTLIPNQPSGGTVTFGALAAPSAVNNELVFTGWDNQQNPALAGIYLAPAKPTPQLQTLVGLQTQVPGEADGVTFTQLGGSLGYDGRYVAFWGAWGSETKPILLTCPTTGIPSVIATCNSMYPNGYQTTVPVHQGIFVYDTATSQLVSVAKAPGEFDGFLYWVFYGRAAGTPDPNVGPDVIPEPPAWRSFPYLSVSGQSGAQFQIVFKAQSGAVDGVFLAQGPAAAPIETVLDTTMQAQGLDPQAPVAASIVGLGMERDGFRGNWFVLTGSMLDSSTSQGMAGVYVTHVPPPGAN